MRRAGSLLIVVAALVVSSSPVSANPVIANRQEPIALDLPALCRLGDDCWIVNYVDVDGGSEARDFQCRACTYNGHDGIDLAVRDRAVMVRGVPVVAAAPGTVRRVRDGVPDHAMSQAAAREARAGQECGNGVVIEHAEGWDTQYCHLRQGSLRVAVGQSVERGQKLGHIGLSGKTEFPHVHLTVRHHGAVIDPFTGRLPSVGCGSGGASLWRDAAVRYEDVALYHAGFAESVPRAAAIRDGLFDQATMAAEAESLVLWVDIFGVQAGDRLQFQLLAPDGHLILDRADRLGKTQARYFGYAGIRRQGGRWPAGSYRGEITLQREQEAVPLVHTRTVTIAVQ